MMDYLGVLNCDITLEVFEIVRVATAWNPNEAADMALAGIGIAESAIQPCPYLQESLYTVEKVLLPEASHFFYQSECWSR